MDIPKKVYMIQQTQWGYTDEWYYRDSTAPIKVFVSREMAEEHCRALETAARLDLMQTPSNDKHSSWSNNLGYTFGELHHLTSLSPEDFTTKIQEFGLPSFPSYLESYTDRENGTEKEFLYVDFSEDAWWENAWAVIPPERVPAFWDVFDLLRFYEVVEVEVEA